MSWRRLECVIPSLRLSWKRAFSTEREDPRFAHDKLDNLDFMTAAKILFTTPPKPKKFGFDFHLVQFFFACLPSVAVYLVAQYARYDIRKREAELEMKKKDEEEAKETKDDGVNSGLPEAGQDPEILQVKKRLDALEGAVKEIVEITKESFSGRAEGLSSNSLNVAPTRKDDADTSAVANTEPESDASPKGTDQEVVMVKPDSGGLSKDTGDVQHQGVKSDKVEK